MKSIKVAANMIVALQEAALSLGGMQGASLAAGWSSSTLRNARHGGMGIDIYGRCIECWDIDGWRLADWTHAIDDQPEAVARFGAEAFSLAKHRAEPPVAKLVRLAYLRRKLDQVGSASPALVARLAALDEQRYNEPVVASAAAMRLLEDTTCADAAARVLGVWASSLRLQRQNQRQVSTNLKRAQALLWLGMRLAGAARLHWVLGDLLQRAVYLVADRSGDFEHARALGKAAEEIFRELGDDDRTGRALVDQGYSLFLDERFEESVPLYERALPLLAPDSRMSVFAAHHALATVLTRQGLLARAAAHANAAAENCDRASAECVHWLRARLAAARGHLDDAAKLYQETMVAQGRRDPANCAVAGSEYARLLLRQGDVAGARRLCRGMRWLVFALQDDLPEAAEAARRLRHAAGEAETFTHTAAVIARRLERAIIRHRGDPVACPLQSQP